MGTPIFLCEDSKKIDLVGWLSSLGYQPQKILGQDYWYCSPLREERTASFKVNRRLNAWFDFGIGKGGNLVDFGLLYYKCTIPELLRKLQEPFSFHQQLPYLQHPYPAVEKKLKVIAVKPIFEDGLYRYLRRRKIPLELAEKYCRQVSYELGGKIYPAIGFQNSSGGYELRNPYFKGSSSPKEISFIDNGAKEIAVFEGFFDLLSYLVILQKQDMELTNIQSNLLVLNSLSFFEKSRPLMEKHAAIHLYLDRDGPGLKYTIQAQQISECYRDESSLYKGYKDLNDRLREREEQRLRQSISRELR